MGSGKVRVGIVGLGFGAEFIPIYQQHPDAEMYAICRRNRAELDECGDRFGIAKRYTSYEEMLADPDLDRLDVGTTDMMAVTGPDISGRLLVPHLDHVVKTIDFETRQVHLFPLELWTVSE